MEEPTKIKEPKPKQSKTEEPKPEPKHVRVEFNTELTLEEFLLKIIEIHNKGNNAVLKHKELFPFHKSKSKNERTGYHAPGTKNDCAACDEIVNAYKEMADLQSQVFNLHGIPIDALVSAIKVTLGTLKLYENSKRKDLIEKAVKIAEGKEE